MATEMITLRVFVMGLAAVLNQTGGKLEIVLPSAKDHVPVLVYPCGKSGCKGEAANVKVDLGLPPSNFDEKQGLLVFKDSYFGAVELNGVEIQLPKRIESSAAAAAGPSLRGGRHHPWYSNWWFHWHGEVPASHGESSDASWLPSLTDIAPCASQLKPENEMIKVLAAYLRSSIDELGLPEVASVGSMLEYRKGYCTASENDDLSDYGTSLSFRNTLWPFASPNQAVADSIVFTIKVPETTITLKKPDGTQDTISPETCEANRTVDILIGNLVPLSGDFNRACITSGLPHVHHYQYLLNNPNCVLPTPQLGWLSTRTDKTVLQQTGDSLPPVIRVVSEKNSSTSAGGYARPLCFMVTN